MLTSFAMLENAKLTIIIIVDEVSILCNGHDSNILQIMSRKR